MWVITSIIAACLSALSVIFLKCGSRRADTSIMTTLRTLVTVSYLWIFTFSNGLADSAAASLKSSFLYIILFGIAAFLTLLFYSISVKNGTVTGVSSLTRLYPALLMLYVCISSWLGNYYYIRLICLILMSVGIILTVTTRGRQSGKWLVFGILASVTAAAADIIFASKLSVKSGTVNLTLVLSAVLVISLIWVFIRGLQHGIGKTPFKDILFILLSGLSAGGAFIAAKSAFAVGNSPTVTAIITADFAVATAIAACFLKEKVSWKAICGILLIVTASVVAAFML